MGKKDGRIENEYSKYSKMNDQEFEFVKKQTEQELAGIDKKIASLEEAVKNAGDDAAKKAQLEAQLKSAKETQDADKARLSKKLERMEGFSKNRQAIEKIVSIRENFIEQSENLKAQKAKNEQEIEFEKEKIKAIDDDPKTKALLVEIAKLDVEDHSQYYAEDWEKYNDLQNQKAEIDEMKATINSRIEKYVKANEAIDQKLEKIEVAISKCNLAWKSLFANKTWDQIHARTMEGRQTRNKAKEAAEKSEKSEKTEGDKKPETAEKTEGDKKPKTAEKTEKTDKAEDVKTDEFVDKVHEAIDAEYEQAEEDTDLVPTSRWQSFLSALRHPVKTAKTLATKIKNYLFADEIDDIEAEEEEEIKKDEAEETKKPKTEEKTEQPKKVEKAEKTETPKQKASQRDAFMEYLQKMADPQSLNQESGKTAEQKTQGKSQKTEKTTDDGPELD